jgi:hypothetical protein
MDLTGAINVLVQTFHTRAGAGDLQEYAEMIPIRRLQFSHNKSAIVIVDVQNMKIYKEEILDPSCLSFELPTTTPPHG